MQDETCARCGYRPSAKEEQDEDLVQEQEEEQHEQNAEGEEQIGWEPVPVWKKQEQKQRGVLTWRDSVKIGCGVAMAPYIFAAVTLFIYVGVSIVLLIFDVFNQDGIGFLIDQFGILIDWLQNLVSERTGER